MNTIEMKRNLLLKIDNITSKLEVLNEYQANLDNGSKSKYLIKNVFLEPIIEDEESKNDLTKIVNINDNLEDFKFLERIERLPDEFSLSESNVKSTFNTIGDCSSFSTVRRLTAPYTMLYNKYSYSRSKLRQLEFATRDLLELGEKIIMCDRTPDLISWKDVDSHQLYFTIYENRNGRGFEARKYINMDKKIKELHLPRKLQEVVKTKLLVENLNKFDHNKAFSVLFKKDKHIYKIIGFKINLFQDLTQYLTEDSDFPDKDIYFDLYTPVKYLTQYLFENSFKYDIETTSILNLNRTLNKIPKLLNSFEEKFKSVDKLKNQQNLDNPFVVYQKTKETHLIKHFEENFNSYIKENLKEDFECWFNREAMQLTIMLKECL